MAGSLGMHGAAHLAGMAALRSGAGLVTVAVPDRIYEVVARREAEVMVKPLPSTPAGSVAFKSLRSLEKTLANQDVFALGPGLSRAPETARLIRRLVKTQSLPMILDADALNAFTAGPAGLLPLAGRAILTPHPKEFLRIFKTFPKSARQIFFSDDTCRVQSAKKAARDTEVYVVLKGHRTVVAAPNGQVYVNGTGNAGMATAGSGDVLTGVISAILAQGFSYWDAARFGVYLHGLAGDLAARKKGQVSLVAGDIIDFLPAAFKKSLVARRPSPVNAKKYSQ